MTSPSPAPAGSPRLVLRFAVYSAIALTLAWLSVFWIVQGKGEERARHEIAMRATEVAARLAPALEDDDFTRPVELARRKELDAAFTPELVGNLMRMKLWSPDGVVTYSNDPSIIGQRAADREELAGVLSGRAVQRVTSLNDQGGTGEDVKAIESYVPIFVGDSTRPAGVLEVYEDYAPVAAEVRETVTPIAIAFGLALLFLYAALFPILHQITKVLENRHKRLEEHAAALARALEERRAAEARLDTAERNYRKLVEQLPLVTYIDRLEERSPSVYMSPQIEALLGYSPLAWMTDRDLFGRVLHPEDRDRILELHRTSYQEANPFVAEYRLVAKDGRVVWVHDEVVIAEDGEGNTYAQGFMLDITERRAAERAMRESESKFRAFVETTDEWVWAMDVDGVRTYSNPAVERIIGYTAEQTVGRPWFDLVVEADRAEMRWQTVQRSRRGRGWTGIVWRCRAADGTIHHLESTATPVVDEDGTLVGWRGTDRDVTDRIQAEAERERLLAAEKDARAAAEAAQRDLAAQNERLRELDRLKDEFLALVSHELRTPLTSIRGYTELLLDGEAGELTEDQLQFLGVVERNTNRLLHLVGDLLFLAQVEAGKLTLELGPLDLAAVAAESVETARPQAEAKGITLTLATGPVRPISGDYARIAQLLDNLVSNAIKFTGEGGRVDVRVHQERERVVVEVRDSGIGIPVDEQPFLFQRFYRTSTATEQAIQGTGLGLAISKAIVDAHAGRIAVASDEGAGTTFRVELPARNEAALAEPARVAL
ncbi:MAG TPA: PAS domain-containing sensor histidine kinase [Gaiellaceae bacterium]|nr:PAS domain-containing sensor histidine kinase [Gaiellaceae bacterium]